MAYMRGDHYLWHDDQRLHLWVRDGYDGWDLSGWAADEDPDAPEDEESKRRPGFGDASGVAVPQDVMDEYVVMRFAELLETRELSAALARARGWLRPALTRQAERIAAMLPEAPVGPAGEEAGR